MTAATTAPAGVEHIANLRRILAEQLGIAAADIAIEHDFLDRLAMDELDVFEFAEAIDRTYGVEITDDEWQDLRTVGDLCALLALAGIESKAHPPAIPHDALSDALAQADAAEAALRKLGLLAALADQSLARDFQAWTQGDPTRIADTLDGGAP